MIPPPTPTLLPPPGTPQFTIPSSYSLWAGAPYAVQSWNLLGDGRAIIQIIFIVALVIVGAYLLTRFLKEFTQKDSGE